MRKRLKRLFLRSDFRTALAFGLILLTIALIVANPAFPDPDPFYHAKIALAIRDQGFIHEFPVLQYTVLNETYVDHHLLYHVLLIPFVTFFDPMIGMKISAICFGMLAFFAVWRWLKYLKSPSPELLTLLASFSYALVNRLSYARAISLSLAVFLLGTWALIERRRILIFGIAFLYVWLYNGWPMLFLALAAVLAGDATSRKLADPTLRFTANLRQTAKTYWSVTVSSLGGLASGLVLNPYFPENLPFSSFLITKIGLGNAKSFIRVGSEWYPVSPEQFFASNIFLVPLFFLCVLLFVMRVVTKPFPIVYRNTIPLFTCLYLAGIFFTLTVHAAHFTEYSVPFLILATGALLVYAWPFAESEMLPVIKRVVWSRRWRKFVTTVFLIITLTVQTLISTTLIDKKYFRAEQYAFAAEWIKNHSEPGDTVFHNAYDFSMILYYLDDERRYILGLDPLFMYDIYPEAYWDWWDISQGHRGVTGIVSKFHARHIVVDSRLDSAEPLLHHLDASDLFTKVGELDGIFLYTCTEACLELLETSPQTATAPPAAARQITF